MSSSNVSRKYTYSRDNPQRHGSRRSRNKSIITRAFISSLADEESKRGFRKGAADRFSHGFGKRFDSLEEVMPKG